MKKTRRAAYRIWQLWKAFTSKSLTIAEQDEIYRVLNPEQMALFMRLDNPSQRHGYRVYKKLREKGYDNQELLQAALLHDVGKAQGMSYWWDKPLVVIAQAISADRVRYWGRGEPEGWKRPFVIKEKHAAWGAELANLAGSSPLTVRLIRQHEDLITNDQHEKDDQLLSILIWADDQS